MNKPIHQDVLALIRKIEAIRSDILAAKERIATAYPRLNHRRDARLTSFNKLQNVLESTRLGLAFLGRHLGDIAWWRDATDDEISVEDIQIHVNEFWAFLKIGLIATSFSAVESSLREVLRSLDSSACSGGTEAFENVYVCLLRSKLTHEPPDGIPLLNLFRHVRNAIHNNGVYFHKKNVDISVLYKSRAYEFKIGKHLDFVSWDFSLDIVGDTVVLLETIANDSAVAGFAGDMIDRSSQ